MKNTSIIIPSKNWENLVHCLFSLRSCEKDPNIIVVSDGAREGELATHIRANFSIPSKFGDLPNCSWVEGVKPFIFSRNMNLGIQAAGNNDVILLNDDTILETELGLSKLVGISKANPIFGVVASSTDSANAQQWPRGQVGVRQAERVVSFVCVFIPRSVIKLVGLLDERFTAYGWDDNDYCRRVTDAGLLLGVYDGCFVRHTDPRQCSSFRGGPNKPGDIRPGARIYHEKWHDPDSVPFL